VIVSTQSDPKRLREKLRYFESRGWFKTENIFFDPIWSTRGKWVV